MSKQKLDLRAKKAVVSPPAPGVLPPLPGNGLPLPTGQVLNLSPGERATLESVGWVDGDPIPDIAAEVERLRREAEAAMPDPNMPAVAPSQVLDINDLSPSARQQLMQNVQQAIEAGKRLEQLQARHVEGPASDMVNKAIDNLTVDVAGKPVAVTMPAPTAVPAATVPTPEPAALEPLRTAAPAVEFCKNCNHRPDEDVIEVTEQDKLNFLASALGDTRFTKEYELFGGHGKVTFRSLTRQELDMAVTQAGCDARDGLTPNNSDFLRRAQNYEMLLGIGRLQVSTDVRNFPEISDVDVDDIEPGKPFQTPLKQYAPYVEEMIQSASLLRILSLAYGRFYRLIRRLEENCYTADFWSGIEPLV